MKRHIKKDIASQVIYLIIDKENNIEWNWIKKQKIIEQTEFLKHIETKLPMTAIADGKKGIGIIKKQKIII